MTITRWPPFSPAPLAILLLSMLGLGCGDGGPTPREAPPAADFPSPIPGAERVYIDTRAVAANVRLGRPVTLPFATADAGVVDKRVTLVPRKLRASDLTTYGLKYGLRGVGRSVRLPPPATYQGRVGERGSAALVITDRVVEGSLLDRDGWAVIEPLEPWLLEAGVPEAERSHLLARYNHLVYHATKAPAGKLGDDDSPAAVTSQATSSPAAEWPLVLRLAADGDRELYQAYPETSVMPFWLKQEALFNALDWQYNCLEPEAGPDNEFADCENRFDGGRGNYHLKVVIESLETWVDGGPDGPDRSALLHQSIGQSHQSEPVCCDDPHTAGKAHHVHFLSGKKISGLAAGIGSVNVYDERCQLPGELVECHHAVSPTRPGPDFPGTVIAQQWMVAHEVGHNIGAHHGSGDLPCWLDPPQCGPHIMEHWFPTGLVYHYLEQATEDIAKAVQGQIGGAPSTPAPRDPAAPR